MDSFHCFSITSTKGQYPEVTNDIYCIGNFVNKQRIVCDRIHGSSYILLKISIPNLNFKFDTALEDSNPSLAQQYICFET